MIRQLQRYTIIVVIITMMVSCGIYVRSMYWRMAVFSGLKKMCLAAHQYHDKWGTLPPVSWKNRRGAEMSFRVALMPFFDSSEAKEVSELAQRVNSASELESSVAFQRWTRTAEGSALLSTNVEFVPVVGEWDSWGSSLVNPTIKGRELPIPLIVAIRSNHKQAWCEVSQPAVAGEKIAIARQAVGYTALTADCVCTISERDVAAGGEVNH